ncbi:transcriptional regulator, IclR family [Clostridium sp. DL-VIII]|nr:transcriptional regulator, IclR family [Clostridium sp. DL-VIII]
MNTAILRGIEILRFVGNSQEPVTIAEISKQLNIPKTSVFNIVNALISEEFLAINNARLKSYELGIGAFELGSLYLNKIELTNIAGNILERLSNDVGETVFLAVVNNNELVYVDKRESTGNLGSRTSMYSTSLGKAILAAYDRVQLENYFEKVAFVPKTKNTIIDKETLIKNLNEIRERGYSISDEENEEGLFCIAVPIYNRAGQVIAALSVSSPKTKINAERIILFKENAIKASLDISRKMGFTKESLY